MSAFGEFETLSCSLSPLWLQFWDIGLVFEKRDIIPIADLRTQEGT